MPADVIDYRLIGDDLQGVVITLDPGEGVIAEAGAMLYMEYGIQMATTLDPNNQGGGLFGKLLGAGKRILTGESFFITMFGNAASRRQDVAFAAPVPGKIKALDLREWGGEIIAQKDSFLCAARGISLDIAFTKRLGVGFFGGEGFILQRFNGDGLVFVHACGALIERELKPGETLRVDTGCLVAMQSTVDYDIQTVPGLKNVLFAGEGIFLVHLTGPGKVILQTLPFARMADKIIAASRMGRGPRREEGSMLGPLGDILSGDRG